ncbi:MAG: multiheme c-type cytochrome [Acidobacteriota bacterium]
MRPHLLPAALMLLTVSAFAAPLARDLWAPGKHADDSCVGCHGQLPDERLSAPAKAANQDIHHTQGISCAGCHGGDPTAKEKSRAMDPQKGFRGTFTAQAIPEMCGSCHSDASLMLRYAPNIPTDQLSQYRTSKHGLALAKGDTNVATCISCHGAHGIRPPTDARSPVYPTRIVDTCGRCHGNRELMAKYGIKGNEVEEYKKSVHYAALTEKNDLSAPTCKSCHGSHGATPPGISSVSNVCGTCHVTQRERFDLSPHKDAFAALDQPACEACHSNHDIGHPSDTLIGIGKGQVCGNCHSEGDDGAKAAAAIAGALLESRRGLEAATARVAKVEREGMLMDDAAVKLEDAHQAYVMAEVEIHTVNLDRVKAQTKQVDGDFGAADRLAAQAEREIRFRRTGLFVSLGVILVAMVALILKVRQIEAR